MIQVLLWLPVAAGLLCFVLPRSAVDSVRFGNPSAGFWKTFGLVVSPIALLIVVCTFPSDPCGLPY